MKIRVYDIVWDTDGEKVDLPTETTIEWGVANGCFNDVLQDTTLEDKISNWLSDDYGWCHNGFKYEIV